jgi:Ca2+-binding EF-hand superfamily protein
MITINRLLQVLIMSTLSLTAAQAAEQEQSTSSAEATFKSLDKDGDQRLSKTEAASDKSLARTLAYLDADGNGFLTLREYTAHMKKPKG